MNRISIFLLCLVVGCGKAPTPTSVDSTQLPPASPAPVIPALPTTGTDAEKLAVVLKPLEWAVNDLDKDAKPRLVTAPIIRSRWEKKTEADFAKLSEVIAGAGIPVIIELAYNGTPATAEWMKHITGNRNVIGVRLWDTINPKKTVEEAAKMTWLELLEIGGEGLDDADFRKLAPLTKLKSVEISGRKMTRASYATLGGMKELRFFDLGIILNYDGPTKAIDADYAVLAGLVNLESLKLQIDAGQSTDAGIAKLKTLKKLTSLEIDYGYGTLAGPKTTELFEAIAGMSDLEELKLHLLLPSVGFAKLAALKKLKKLTFIAKGLVDGEPLENFTKHIGAITSLEVIDRTDSQKMTNEMLADMKGLTNLRKLDLSESLVTDEGLAHLAGMKQLAHLDLSKTAVTDACIPTLKKLSALTFLDIGKTKVTDAGLAELKTDAKLKVSR